MRKTQRYQSDLTDEEWRVIAPHLPEPSATGRPRSWAMREILNGIFYVMRARCACCVRPAVHFPSSQGSSPTAATRAIGSPRAILSSVIVVILGLGCCVATQPYPLRTRRGRALPRDGHQTLLHRMGRRHPSRLLADPWRSDAHRARQPHRQTKRRPNKAQNARPATTAEHWQQDRTRRRSLDRFRVAFTNAFLSRWNPV
jgi:hypothetical protein